MAEVPRIERRLGEALALVDLVHADARAARDKALALLAARRDDEAACVALRALGLARQRLGELAGARSALRSAVGLGQRRGFTLRAAEARMSLLVILADAGNTQAALAEAALAEAALTGLAGTELELARLRVNLGLVLQRTGRSAEALACYAVSEQILRERGDARWEAIMLNLRGTLFAYRGDHEAADRDLTRAADLARRNGFAVTHQNAVFNLGFAALRAGDLPRALRTLDEARVLATKHGKPIASVLTDRAEALLTAGLADEARACAQEAVLGHERSGFAFNLAESRLSVARAALKAGDPAAAAEQAHAARVAFSRQRRPGWAAWARTVEHGARFASGERSAALLRDMIRNIKQTELAGWLVTPQETRLLAAHTALAIGRRQTAVELYSQVAASRLGGPAGLRVFGWEAETALCELRGDSAGAGRAIDRGLREVAEYAGTLGATDLRTAAAQLGADLAQSGLRLALDRGSPRQVLVRAEQWRAATLRRRPVQPPDDTEFAAKLARLRAVVAQISEGGLAGKNISGLQTLRVRLEREIRELARFAPGGDYAPEPPLDLKALATRLEDRALVEFVRHGDDLHAVSLVEGRMRHHRLGSYKAVLDELESLRFSLQRMALRYGSAAMQQATYAAFDYARQALDNALLRPMGKLIENRALVLVPTGSLHALAWSVLPSTDGRPVTVAPSARTWLTAMSAHAGHSERTHGKHGHDGHDEWPAHTAASSRGERVALACGPGPPHAEAEIEELAKRYPLAKPLYGEDATAQAVADALDGADLAHIAAHGRFRADNPLFSSLDLADGPLTVYDLERLRQAPRTLVLSACDTALSGIRPGDELMGVASAVFALGTRTLIAAVVPVGDAETKTLMSVFHEQLAAGASPALALTVAQHKVPDARGFVCFGAG
ncbi:MAG TPA: CHAT domain-containing tetratricopeptide repeat protein [Actinocrinis sp.]|jgi:tetratricopeptide (TPR) repeat protein|uniref:CHAT domain-containing protein n=1 Tax=Actinocrinis sp. TaxID=1920516 RepID=UPI002DDD1B3A|nr:CHAT domain-containing tetratricopeptide repeat protein [Actinocrinis sp.]HEV3174309.1 CHAT domain-containing tetratricopeptide repeat protein [Actinocrinis sp.]